MRYFHWNLSSKIFNDDTIIQSADFLRTTGKTGDWRWRRLCAPAQNAVKVIELSGPGWIDGERRATSFGTMPVSASIRIDAFCLVDFVEEIH